MIARHQIRSKDILLAQTCAKPQTCAEAQALTCDDCFAILEHLANTAIAGADDNDLRIAVQSYLAHCPDGLGYCDQRIQARKYWL